MVTKVQAWRETMYRRQLKACGFRSWKSANQRRGDLINKKINGSATEPEIEELDCLQCLATIYVKWKTNDEMGRAIRRLRYLEQTLLLDVTTAQH